MAYLFLVRPIHTHVDDRCFRFSVRQRRPRSRLFATLMARGTGALRADELSQASLRSLRSSVKVTKEIACEIRIEHLIGVYAKPYRDDLVLSFAAIIISGIPRTILKYRM